MKPPRPSKLWNEKWHIAALVVAFFPLLSHIWLGSIGDPWESDRQELTEKLTNASDQFSREKLELLLQDRLDLVWRADAVFGFGFVLFVSGMVAWVRLFSRKRKGKPTIVGVFQAPEARWGLWDVVKIFAWSMVGVQIIHFLVALVVTLLNIKGFDRHMEAATSTLCVDLMVVALVFLLVLKPLKLSWRALGLFRDRLAWQIKTGCWGYTLWIPLMVVVMMALVWVTSVLQVEAKPQAAVVMMFQESRPRLLLVLTGLIAVIGPVAEEILFRGLAFVALKRRFGVRVGLIGSAALFAGAHANAFAFAPIFALGWLLGWLYERTGSLVPSIVVHMLHNTGMLFLTMTIKDILSLLSV